MCSSGLGRRLELGLRCCLDRGLRRGCREWRRRLGCGLGRRFGRLWRHERLGRDGALRLRVPILREARAQGKARLARVERLVALVLGDLAALLLEPAPVLGLETEAAAKPRAALGDHDQCGHADGHSADQPSLRHRATSTIESFSG